MEDRKECAARFIARGAESMTIFEIIEHYTNIGSVAGMSILEPLIRGELDIATVADASGEVYLVMMDVDRMFLRLRVPVEQMDRAAIDVQ